MKTCIIKTAALGDVLRTTPILRALKGKVTWITSKEALPLLENNDRIKRIKTFPEISTNPPKDFFDLVLSLEESPETVVFASRLKTKKLIGVFFNEKTGKVEYTDESKSWFDMSLISQYGKEVADRLKKQNTLSYQHHLFAMIGKTFAKEEYLLNSNPNPQVLYDVGLEPRVGKIWPTKGWPNFDEINRKLRKLSCKTFIFKQRETLSEYIADISKCKIIVSGDSLAMHLGIVLKKKVIGIFGSTSSSEIYDYGRLTKIVSNYNCRCCYKKTCDKKPNCMESIKVSSVLSVIKQLTSL